MTGVGRRVKGYPLHPGKGGIATRTQRCGSEAPWTRPRCAPLPDLPPRENPEDVGCKITFVAFSKQGHFKILIITNKPLKPALLLTRAIQKEKMTKSQAEGEERRGMGQGRWWKWVSTEFR